MTVQFTTLFSFNSSNYQEPEARLTVDANGDLFGATPGSANGYGMVFEIQNTGTVAAPVYVSTPTMLVEFNGANGAQPNAALIVDANGDLFGTTEGGAGDDGTVFEIQNTGTVAAPVYASAPTTLVSFNGANGANPWAGLTVDANGDLFGTTAQGGANGDGTVFEIQNTGTVAAPVYANAPTTLVSFNGANGAQPYAGVTADANGDLFGTTTSGGANGVGTVFEIQNTGTVAAPVYASAPTTLVSFNGANGENPYGGVTIDANGDLFGTAYEGGAYGAGTVFEIQNTGTVAAPVYASAPTTLVSFDRSDGYPLGGLIVDANGDLFGTVTGAGVSDGSVFEIQNTGTVAAPVYASAPTTLVSFNGANGETPVAGLTAGANGDLFGTTAQGGASGDGTVFEISGAFVVAPTISGTVGGQTTTSETPVKPFAQATIGDANAGATDTLTITLGGAGGTLADGAGFNSLTPAGAGVYTLSGTAAAITSELDALIFTPKAGAPNTSSTTTFTLSDQSSAGGAPVVDGTTSVIDNDPYSVGGNGANGRSILLSLSNSAIVELANSRVTLSGSNDTVTMGAGSNLTVNGSNDAITATTNDTITIKSGTGDTITINSGTGDTITGSGFTVSAAAGTAFAVGGNGLSGALDNVNGSGASVTVQAKSNVALNGSSDTVTMGAGSNLTVNGSNDAITATKGDGITVNSGAGDTISGSGFTVYGGSGAGFTIVGTGDVVYAGLNDAITDSGSSTKFKINSNVGNLVISGFGTDPTGIIDLLNGAGGYTKASQAFAALTSDGHGGSKLSLGADGSIDFVNVAPSSLHASNFKIG